MLIFDIETDGLLEATTKVHCLTYYDSKTDEYTCCSDHEGYVPIEEGVKALMEADCITGHNVCAFDIPALKKVFPWFQPKGRIRDTLILSRLICSDIEDQDFARIRRAGGRRDPYFDFPKQLIGRHSLKAWGYRLGVLKDDFGETTDWQEWTPEMQEYNKQDVVVTVYLCRYFTSFHYDKRAIELEHQFQDIILKQEENGFPFDKEKAVQYYATLASQREKIKKKLQDLFPPIDKGEWFVPKVNNKLRGYVKGVRTWKPNIVEFNPASRQDIGNRLITVHGWKPEEFTDRGQPKVDEEILNALPWPEAKELATYFMLQKRIGQLAEGNNAWLQLVKPDGRIHGRVITNGAVTGRCTHLNPNMAQVPSVGVPWGAEFRGLFYAPEGYVVVGADASGLELRCLAHYMARYDGGAYARTILSGDIHWANAQLLGLVGKDEVKDPENEHHMWARNKVAKRFIYALNYGAGDKKLGECLGLSEEDIQAVLVTKEAAKVRADFKRKQLLFKDADVAHAVKGAELRATFMKNLPALKALVEDVKRTAKEKGFLKGLDGRLLHVRSQHSALNTLLQSAGAVAVKKATCILWDDLKEAGLASDVQQVAHVHDEYQLLVVEGKQEIVGKIAVEAFRKAGEYFSFRIPLAGEFKVGRNWAETH